MKEYTAEYLKEYALKNHVPILNDDSKTVLIECLKNNNPKAILEIGTAIGYSGVTMLQECNCQKLITVEIDKQRYDMANEVFKFHGLNDRVLSINDDANLVISDLKNKNYKFDFIFLDGPKGQYLKYYNTLKDVLNIGGVIFADNINYRNLISGNDLPPRKVRTIVVNMRKFLNQIKEDKDMQVDIINIGDGIAKITKLR